MPRLRRLRKWLALAAGLIMLRTTCVNWYFVSGQSMNPTLRPGDVLVCHRLAYGLHVPGFLRTVVSWRTPLPGEIVLFRSPSDDRVCVKRVVEPPADRMVPSDHVWLEGDNLGVSIDSRHHGPVARERICGRVTKTFLRFGSDSRPMSPIAR